MKQQSLSRYSTVPDHVYLFGTCIVDVGFAQGGVDATDLIESLGIRVHYPQQQSCCGQPAYTSGLVKEARKVARAQLSLFPEPWPIVVLSGSCTGMFREHWQDLFAEDDPDRAQVVSISERAVELMEFIDRLPQGCLEKLIEQSPEQAPQSVVIHTSCSARNETLHYDATASVLSKLPNIEVKKADHETECCGFGGSFSVRFPNISGKMVDDKCQSLTATQADSLISGDCACLMNINGRLAKRGDQVQGQYLGSFLKQQLLGDE